MVSKKIALISILLLTIMGAYLRVANLGQNPRGFYVDEASTGYNAWSILQTGKDEYGMEFPLTFRFLGSYTPPLYTYLSTIPIHFNGLTVESVRFISALSGIILIPIIFFFIRSLSFSKNTWIPILASLLVAISPWSLFFSRIGYETHLAFLLYTIGVFALWISIKKPVWFIASASFLALSANTYQSERLLAPLTVLTVLYFYRKIFFRKEFRKFLYLGLGTYFLVSLPQIVILFTPASTARGFGLFYSDEIYRQMRELFLPGPIGFIIAFSREFFSQFFSYLSPRNLFFQPDSDLQRSLPELSAFYPWTVALYFIGIFSLINIRKKAVAKFIIILLLLSPIPAALTGDPFSTQRALPLLLPILIILSLGLNSLFSSSFKLYGWLSILLLLTVSFLQLYRSLAVYLPNERSEIWGYGFEQLVNEIRLRPGENFLIDSGRIKPAYIELAFFLKYPPEKFQEEVDQSIKEDYYRNTVWNSHYKFANIETRAIDWEEDIYKGQILVGDELSISEQQEKEHFLTKVFEIKSSTQKVIFKGYKTNPKLKCKQQYVEDRC